ncbi:MAG TPA: DUF3267 domain-containing protein [Anaerolineales bacterium]|nr:DUF3267 domain-containing protein [Anaerolineales bacterium]
MDKTDDLSVSAEAASRYVLIFSLPLAVSMLAVYFIFSPDPSFRVRLTGGAAAILLAAMVAGIFAHEAVHGLSWAIFGRLPISRIRFGLHRPTMTPYAHALDPMPAWSYRAGAALPAIVLGIVPYLAGVLLGHWLLALYGLLFTLAAGADLLVLWLIRKVDGRTLIRDHPSRVGCLVGTGEA